MILCRKTLRKRRAEGHCWCSKSYRRAWRSSQTPSEPIPWQYLSGLPGTVEGGSGYGESGGRGMKDCLMLIVSSFSVWLLSVLLAIMHILSTHSPLNRPWPPVRMHVPSTACDVIGFNGQCQLCPLTCAEWRDLSKMSTIQSRTTEKKVKKPCNIDPKMFMKILFRPPPALTLRCKSLFKHGKSSVKLKLKTKTNYNCFTWLLCGILKALLKNFSYQNEAY